MSNGSVNVIASATKRDWYTFAHSPYLVGIAAVVHSSAHIFNYTRTGTLIYINIDMILNLLICMQVFAKTAAGYRLPVGFLVTLLLHCWPFKAAGIRWIRGEKLQKKFISIFSTGGYLRVDGVCAYVHVCVILFINI